MPDERLPNKVFYGELKEGKRSECGQTKRYNDTLKASLKEFQIGSLEQTAQERSKWQGLINRGSTLRLYEENGICVAKTNLENAMPRSMGHQHISLHILALLATDSLELGLV